MILLKVNVPVAVILLAVSFPLMKLLPATVKRFDGEVEPRAKLPLPNIVRSVVVPVPVADDEAIMKRGLVPARPELSCIENLELGVVEPIPKFPF